MSGREKQSPSKRCNQSDHHHRRDKEKKRQSSTSSDRWSSSASSRRDRSNTVYPRQQQHRSPSRDRHPPRASVYPSFAQASSGTSATLDQHLRSRTTRPRSPSHHRSTSRQRPATRRGSDSRDRSPSPPFTANMLDSPPTTTNRQPTSIQRPTISSEASALVNRRIVTEHYFPSFFDGLCNEYGAASVQRAYDHLFDKDLGVISVNYHPDAAQWIRPVNSNPRLALVERIKSLFSSSIDPIDGEWFHPDFPFRYPADLDEIQTWTPPAAPWPRITNKIERLPDGMVYPEVMDEMKHIGKHYNNISAPHHRQWHNSSWWGSTRAEWMAKQLRFIQDPASAHAIVAPWLDWDHHQWYAFTILVVKLIMTRSFETAAAITAARRTIAQARATAFTFNPEDRSHPKDRAQAALRIIDNEIASRQSTTDSAALGLLEKTQADLRRQVDRFSDRRPPPATSTDRQEGQRYRGGSMRSTPYAQLANDHPRSESREKPRGQKRSSSPLGARAVERKRSKPAPQPRPKDDDHDRSGPTTTRSAAVKAALAAKLDEELEKYQCEIAASRKEVVGISARNALDEIELSDSEYDVQFE